MKGRLIAIEGLDVVGKTTLAKSLCKLTGAVYCRTPPEQYLSRCTTIDKNVTHFNENRFNLFVESVQCASREIELLINKGMTVVVDRWIWTTLAYHFAGNN